MFRRFFKSEWGAALLLLGCAVVSIAAFTNRESIGYWLLRDSKIALENAAMALQDLLTITLGVIVEALPFVVLGVLISVAIQVFVPAHVLLDRLPKNIVLRRIVISFLGVLLPVCECGNVPVARSLLVKGCSVPESLVFLLAAPSVNIITFVVTWEAFNFNHGVAIWRLVLTLIIANVAAYVVGKLVAPKDALTPEFALDMFRSEMWLIVRMLCIGALIAAAFQVFVPREAITAIADNPALMVLSMLVLAFVISICSSVDAFFALAYANTFSLGSIVAFLVAGPMVDIKMLSLMKTTYTTRVLVLVSATVMTLTFLAGLGLSYVW
jgi:uncharacterized membrane protein YraQ (UPF0718 family)